jgi:threonyl-tRNA synthetase
MADAALTITLPDGSRRELPLGATPGDVAASIGAGLAKAALAARVDGELWDLGRPILLDAALAIVTAKDTADALELVRHDFAHVLAEAVQKLFPGTQITFGPSTETGFYYDFAPKDRPFTEDDLPAIEAEMRRIIAANKPLRREVWTRDGLIQRWQAEGETFKAQWAAELPDGEELTVYWSGDDWLDMCRGPHLPSTGKLPADAFKLTKVAGAYWRGDAKNAMLSRIYGVAFLTRKELDAHLLMVEEAEKRDHRKIGREMGLFHLQEIAHGSVFWHPHGWTLYRTLEQYMRRRLELADYVEVRTPQLFNTKLWKTSGHWQKFREGMFVVPDMIHASGDGEGEDALAFDAEAEPLALKPMNCPAHTQIFAQGVRSYRELPIRMAEFGNCHRNEPHGALHGLMRVRQFVQDDAHIFCRRDQFVEECLSFFELLKSVYNDLGFSDWSVKLATRPALRAGAEELWDFAEAGLADALNRAGLPFQVLPGEGAFYGPKIEFHLKDAIGRTWQCGTIQLDPVLPGRFGISYIAEDGSRQEPVMLHRAILGSFERFIAILIENYAGKFPLWLAPRQVVVATIVSDADDYARAVVGKLKSAGIRAETDTRNEKINYKVREHSLGKVPVMLVVGKREAEEGTVAVRRLGVEKQETLTLEAAIATLQLEALAPDLRPEICS